IVMAATHVRPEDINFMAKHARGLICLTLTRQRCQQLDLPLMVTRNGASHGTNFTMSIEAASGVTTGISAADRAHTVQVAVAREAKPSDIVQPGHIFPLMAQAGGVLHRAGHTEAGCDLARLAGLEPAAVIVEIMNEDGTMARRPDLEKFAEQHNLKIGTIADLIHYRMVNEQTVKRVQENILPTEYGDFRLISYQEHAGSDVHIALIKGDVQRDTPVVRVHAVNPLRDLLHAKYQGRTGWNLQKSLGEIAKHDAGILVLLGQDYQSSEVVDHIKQFFDGRPRANDGAGMYRTIGVGSQILRDLGVSKMRLLSSPMRFNALSGFGLEIVEYLATE
ncbi:MAG TPA: 3,4-dihydroxy-2-butanone-4-phosphate synthase, partial [Agitococcus sp.]|nr:3,4-dihydroxy-2-butanone-4-phosphate synthase [Agitococcus sp.]